MIRLSEARPKHNPLGSSFVHALSSHKMEKEIRLPAPHPRFRPRLEGEMRRPGQKPGWDGKITGSLLVFLVKPVYNLAIKDRPVPPS
jgi:hypothetical protein